MVAREPDLMGVLWAGSPDLLAVVDGAGRIVAVNPAWTTHLGAAPSEAQAAFFADFPLEEAAWAGPLWTRAKEGRARLIEWRLAHADGYVLLSGRAPDPSIEAWLHELSNGLQAASGGLDRIRTLLAAPQAERALRWADAAAEGADRAIEAAQCLQARLRPCAPRARADDNAVLLFIPQTEERARLVETLENLGVCVLEAADEEQALDVLETISLRIDLMLGEEVSETLQARAKEVRPSLQILTLSELAGDDELIAAVGNAAGLSLRK